MQAGRLSLVIGVLVLAPSWYMFEVYGRVLNSRSESTLAWLLVAALGIYATCELLDLARSRVLRKASEAIVDKLNQRVFDASFAAYLRKLPGGTTQPLSDVRTVGDFVASPVVTGVMDLPSSLLCLVLLYLMNLWVGVLGTVIAALVALLGWLQDRRGARPYGEANSAAGHAQTRAASTLRNAQVVEAMGMRASMYRRWTQTQRQFMNRLAVASDNAGTLSTLSKLLTQLQGSLLLGLACWMALGNALWGGIPMVIVASILGGRVLAPMAQIAGQWRQIGAMRASMRRLDELLRNVPAPEIGLPLPTPKGNLLAENLIVTPPGASAPVLKGVSFQALPGELLTVIGPSAAGKTSLARALVGVWASQGGKVRLDGADVHAWHKSQLGPHIGYLSQGVELFDGSVAENIARFGKVDMDKVRAATDMVGVTELIESLPQGFDTQIGDEGAVLSGGQRQRLGLARAVYGSPRLVVLDEPNASLDEAGERGLLQTLLLLKAQKTTVIAITHRTSLLKVADKLLLMQDGMVSKFGKRDDVLAAVKAANEEAAARIKAARAAALPPANSQGAPA
jgi:ATP-binding cassette subfamily C exporter for protease/lipase